MGPQPAAVRDSGLGEAVSSQPGTRQRAEGAEQSPGMGPRGSRQGVGVVTAAWVGTLPPSAGPQASPMAC